MKNNSETDKNMNVMKRFFLIFIPLLLLISAVTYYSYRVESKNDLNIAEINEIQFLNHVEHLVLQDFKMVTSDLKALIRIHTLQELLNGNSSAQGRLTKDWLVLAETKAIYDQVRFLDVKGQEVVRIDYHNGQPVIVPADQLQNKHDRYYFMDTFKLGKEELFVSPLDLNIEYGQIEQPLKPMIRFGAPVFDQHGEKRGIVLLNYLGKQLIDRFTGTEGDTAQRQRMLLNVDGYWLAGPDPERAWGFMYGNDETFGSMYPEAWAQIQANDHGQFVTNQGLFTFTKVYPLDKNHQYSSTGSAKPFENSKEIVTAQNYGWAAVTFIPAEILASSRHSLVANLTWLFVFFALITGTISWLLAISWAKREKVTKAMSEATNIVNRSPAVAFLWENKEGWPVAFVSENVEKLLGYSAQEFVKGVISYSEVIHHNDLEIVAEEVVVCSGTAGMKTFVHQPYRIVAKNGGTKWVSDTTYIRRNSQGEITHYEGMVHDITDLEQAKEALNESEASIKMLLNSMTEGVCGVDTNGLCTFCNQPALDLLGYKEHELLGQPFHKLVTRSEVVDSSQPDNMIVSDKPDHNDDIVFWRADGSCFNVEYRTHPITRKGEIVGAVSTFLDITENKKLLEHRFRTSHLVSLGELAAGMGHEINNPIGGVINYAQMLINKHPEEGPDRDISCRILKEGTRVASIVKNLLSFAQRGQDEVVPLNIESVLTVPLQMVVQQLDSDGIVLDVEIESGLPNIFANDRKLGQVMLNLISNSRYALNEKYPGSHPDKILRIIARQVSRDGTSRLQLTVWDQGCGIQKEHLPKIFNPFFTTKAAGVGTGLGLSNSLDILMEHNAIIHVDSDVGLFTNVVIEFPVAEGDS